MTKTQANELAELGLDETQLAERQAKVAQIINGGTPYDPGGPFNLDTLAKPPQIRPAKAPRAPRRDKGVPRAPKPAATPPAGPGALSVTQAERIKFLAGRVQGTQKVFEDASASLIAAVAEFNTYIDSLTAQER